MEIEFINNHMIRVVISNQDLTDRSLSLMELLGDHAEIESFFYDILDEIDTGDRFKDSEQVTFQVLPNRNGVELFISTIADEDSADQLTGIFDDVSNFQKNEQIDKNIKNQLMELDTLEDAKRLTTINPDDNWSIFKLERFDAMIHLSHRINQKLIKSDFYSYQGSFYLVMRYPLEKLNQNEIQNINSILTEFGTRQSKEIITPAKLDSQGKLLMQDNAIETSKTYFKS